MAVYIAWEHAGSRLAVELKLYEVIKYLGQGIKNRLQEKIYIVSASVWAQLCCWKPASSWNVF